MRIIDSHSHTRQEQIDAKKPNKSKTDDTEMKQNFKAGFEGVEEKATSFIALTKGQDLQRG